MANILSLESQEGLFDYFHVYMPAPAATQISRTICNWSKNKGCEWTVSRLKDLKTQLLNFYGGNQVVLVKSRKNGIAFGPFAYLFKIGLDKAMRTVHVYTSFISPRMTKKQKLKFVTAVESSFTDDIRSVSNTDNFNQVLIKHLRKEKSFNIYSFFDGKQRAPHLVNGTVKTVPETSLNPSDIIEDFVEVCEANRALLWGYVELLASSLSVETLLVTKALSSRKKPFEMNGSLLAKQVLDKPIVGTIGFIQEKGAKLRSVANPFRILQCLLKSLGDYLYDLLKVLPWDCTHNQEEGAFFAQNSLRMGKTVYAYDLSNATDKLPLDIQTNLLEQLVSQVRPSKTKNRSLEHASPGYQDSKQLDLIVDSINLLRRISRSKWSSPSLNGITKETNFLSWETGQPQGLYPSFAMFAVTHGFILREIERDLMLNDTFRIVGDDVVINNMVVALKYKARMQDLGVEISATKSIVSKKLTEFVGFIITEDNITSSYKWQDYKPSNPLGPIKALGLNGMKFVPFKARRFVRTIASLPYPIGLGLNPLGVPLETRMLPVWKLYETKQYNSLTENSYSYSDVLQSQQEFWDNVVIPEDLRHYCYRRQEQPVKPYLSDSLNTNHDISIEHFNASTKGVTVNDRLDLSNLTIPDISDTKPQRGKFKKNGFVMSNLRKAYIAIRDYVE